MKNEECKEELVKSIKAGEFTENLEIRVIGMISRFFDKYPYKNQEWYHPDHEFLFKKNALEACKKHSLKFNPERSDNAFAYIVQIIKSDFAGTYLKIVKEYKLSLNDKTN